MKILLSAYSCAPDSGSEPGCGWNWAVELAKLGNQVWCLTALNNKAVIRAKLKKDPVENLHFIFVELPNWLEKAKFRFSFPMSYVHYFAWQHKAYKIAQEKHHNINFDIVHHVTYGSLQLGSYMWKLPVPFIFGPVGGGEKVPDNLAKYSSDGFFRELLRKATSFIMMDVFKSTNATSKASLVLTTSCETADVAKSLGAEKVKLFLDSGIATDFMPDDPPGRIANEHIDVLWVGKFLPQKGLSLVLDVFNALERPHNIRLTIVGDGPLAKEHKAFVNEHKLNDVISFVGMVSFAQLKEYYLSHDILMFCPLRNAFGIQMLESMACGMPVITLDQHGAGALIPDGVCVKVPPKDDKLVETLKKELLKLANNEKLRMKYSQKGYDYALENLWSKKAENITIEYHNVLEEKQSVKRLRLH